MTRFLTYRMEMSRSVWLPPVEPEVERELFLLGWKILLPHSLGQVVLSSIIAYEVWSEGIRQFVWPWILGMYVTALLLLALWQYYRRYVTLAVVPAHVLSNWRWIHVLVLTSVGVGWGLAAQMMSKDLHLHNLTIMLAYVGAMSYSAMSNAPNSPGGFFVSSSIATALVAWCVPHIFAQQADFVMGMIAIYTTVLIIDSRDARINLLSSIRLRFANERLAQENAATALRAEQANRDKSEFFAAASHDLRQPVHALLLLVEAFRQKEPAIAEHPLVRSIASAGQSISSLFNSLMELSRLESGTERLSHTVFSLPELMDRLLQRSKAEAERKGLLLCSVISHRAQQMNLYTDKVLLERVLSNLITNALRYTEQGKILITVRPSGSSLVIDVHDTGIGIAADDLDRIFDPYVQISNHERDRSKGLGLGLAIVKQSVRLLSIELSVRSQLGKGSRFRLHIPAKLVSSSSPTSTSPQALPAQVLLQKSSVKLADKKILLVDDDPMVVSAMQALLTSWQMNLRCATRADESVWEVMDDAWMPDCILCDFRLPGPMDGVELLDMLLERYPQAVGILQTGELAQAMQRKAEDAGYLVLFKPVSPLVLASTLTAVLSSQGNTTTGIRR